MKNKRTCQRQVLFVNTFVDIFVNTTDEIKIKKLRKLGGFYSRGRGIRTPVNGFGDRRTATVLFPYLFCCFTNELYYSKKQFKRQAKNAILWKKVWGHGILISVCY